MDSPLARSRQQATKQEPLLPADKSSSSSGVKRPAPSLLPPFEPLSSSPALPRPAKRLNMSGPAAHLKYPTPVPTSSTGILSSSPVQRCPRRLAGPARERVPLSAVPAVELPENGETVVLGRSSNSSHFQLSANRLVSRVHVRARYVAAAAMDGRIEIVCEGWNGLRLHCQGRTWELFKGDTFTSETDGADIMVDVLDARVIIQWPRRAGAAAAAAAASLSDASWDDSLPPQSSPPLRSTRIASPESPTPAPAPATSTLSSLLPGHGQDRDPDRDRDRGRDQGIHIYEDEEDGGGSGDEEPELPVPRCVRRDDAGASMCTEATSSFSSELSDHEDDPDEENDPIIHSFGPFGADISGRMASITTKSPKPTKRAPRRRPRTTSSTGTLTMTTSGGDKTPSSPASPSKKRPSTSGSGLGADAPSSPGHKASSGAEFDPAMTNHVVNQLAFSRLSSTPLSTIMQNLPAESKALAPEALREAIESTPCIGIIRRQGKDAAGKPLETEYYYVAERDGDERRRAAVVDGLLKPSLRNCRKQHKVLS